MAFKMLSTQAICAWITVAVMMFGLITNVIVYVTARKLSSMRSSFGIITKNQAICNILMCVLFLIFVGPLQLTPIKFPHELTHFVGTASMILYEFAAQLNFFNSLNRFCAVYMIFYYDRIFSNFNTYLLRNIAIVVSTAMCVTFYEVLGCYLYLDDEIWVFSYPEGDERCNKLSFYCDFVFNLTLVIGTMCLNLLAAYKARRLHRMVSDTTGVRMSKEQRQREMNFIRQSFFQGCAMSVALVFYRVTADYVENPILLFVDCSLWAFMLGLEGGIILLSNQELLLAVRKKRAHIVDIRSGNLDYIVQPTTTHMHEQISRSDKF